MERQPRDPRIEGFIVDNAIPIPGIEWEGAPDPLPLDHDRWFAWYGRQLARRAMVWDQCARDPHARKAHDALCAIPGGLGHIYWLATFGFINEPRNDGDMAHLPFIPGPAQAELILLIHACMATPKGAKSSLAGEKSREVGFTWIDLSHHTWCWLFEPWYTGLLASFTEDKVDKDGDSSTMFWKVLYLLERMPSWMLPRGFEFRKPHRVHLFLRNPQNKSTIRGTATVGDIGRSGRYRKISFDEANSNPYFREGWDGANNSTDHRFAYSTASARLHWAFHNLVRGVAEFKYAQPTVFIFHWWMYQGRDEAWLQAQKESMSEQAFNMEILMDYRADIGAFVYPVFERHGTSHIEPTPHLPKYVSIDDGYTDRTALSGWQVHPQTGDIDALWAYENFGKTIDFYGCLLTGQMRSDFSWTDYDRDLIIWLQKHHLTEATYYGDRHGDDTNMVTGTSPFQELTTKFGIYILTTLDPLKNYHKARQDDLASLASRIRFNDSWGAPSLLHAIRNSRFPERSETSQQTNEARKPIHDSGSHLRTSAEYFAVNYKTTMFDSPGEDAMMLPPNPVSRFGEQFEQAHRRRRGEIPTTEEAIPRWMR
jgi:hypothetical protein